LSQLLPTSYISNCLQLHLMIISLVSIAHHRLTIDIVEVDKLLVDELRLKHWDCTLVFYVAGLEGQHDILQYIKPNHLSKDAQIIMECIAKGYPKHCMMKFPQVYPGEMMWYMLKSSVLKAGEEWGYTL
jgi:hypothetical protein